MSESIKLGLFTYDVKNGLGLIGYNVDEHEHAHIIVETSKCNDCSHMMCVWGCLHNATTSVTKALRK